METKSASVQEWEEIFPQKTSAHLNDIFDLYAIARALAIDDATDVHLLEMDAHRRYIGSDEPAAS